LNPMKKNKTLEVPIEERIEDLLERMTLEEKVAQLGSIVINDIVDENNNIFEEKLEQVLKNGCGQISRSAWMLGDILPEDAIKLVNQIQKYLIKSTRLGIPAILHEECLNGVQVKHGTVFPQSIGVASTWNEEAVLSMGECLRKQLRAEGATQGLAPVLDVVRDARWGRVEETFGEDPYLISKIGTAYVTGLQGDDLKEGVLATAKHFLGYGVTEGGMNWAPSHINARELREVYGRPFEAAIKEAKLGSVMNSYSEIDGVPCAVSKELLTNILRDEFKFEGIVVSDYGAIDTVSTYHLAATDMKDAGVKTINAGMDVELPFTKCYGDLLVEAIKEGKVGEEVIEQSVRRVLKKKFELGLFENVFVSPDNFSKSYKAKENKQIARKLAKESIVLLKNKNKLLPLSKQIKSLALIGPSADSVRNLLGDYNYASNIEGQIGMYNSFEKEEVKLPDDIDALIEMCKPYESHILPGIAEVTDVQYQKLEEVPENILKESIAKLSEGQNDSLVKLKATIQLFQEKGLDAIVEDANDIISLKEAMEGYLSSDTMIHYAKGCEIVGGTKDGFGEAIEAAKVSEVAVIVMGDKAGLDAGSTSGESRDRADLNLPGYQLELLKEIQKTGTPIVLVLINGRPLSTLWENENIEAIIEAWLPGEEGAMAITEVLFGDYNPGGKLPISVPKSVGQVPVFYNHKPSGGRSHWQGSYVELDTKPLYEFGYGLSYTEFEYSNLTIDKETVTLDDEVQVSITVRNVGSYEGDEVVQLYVRDLEANITRPVKQLYGYKRITLAQGQKATVCFTLPMDLLGFYDENMDFVVEPGKMEIYIGASSQDIQASTVFEIKGDTKKIVKDKVFFSETKVRTQ
jgi:beta-glucosidase